MKTFTPDSSIVSDVIPSMNYGDRNNGRLADMILLHYTGMPDVEGAIAQLCTAGTDVSAHYIVLEDGRIVQCVPESKRAWHAGVSCWAGEEDINSCSIGIEIINPGHDWGYPDFPLRQIAAVIALCRGIMLRRKVLSHRVLAHSDVAPARKKDPGEKFPWHSLANSGVGHWVQPAPIVRSEALKLGSASDDVARPAGGAGPIRLQCPDQRQVRRRHHGSGRRVPASLPSRARRRHRRSLDHEHAARAAGEPAGGCDDDDRRGEVVTDIPSRHCEERSDEAIHLSAPAEGWIASRSLSSGGHWPTRWLAMTET